MKHEIEEIELSISDSNIKFEDIYEKNYIPQEYISDIKNANLLLIPEEDHNRYNQPVFPELTSEFWDYLKNNAPEEIISDIAISDEDFNKLELHSATIIVATFIVTSIVLPLTINLVSSYLYDKAKQMHRKEDELSAEINIIVQNGSESKQISYKGPIKGIKETLDSTVPHLFKNE